MRKLIYIHEGRVEKKAPYWGEKECYHIDDEIIEEMFEVHVWDKIRVTIEGIE